MTYYAQPLVAVTGQGLGTDPREWLAWYQQTYGATARAGDAAESVRRFLCVKRMGYRRGLAPAFLPVMSYLMVNPDFG